MFVLFACVVIVCFINFHRVGKYERTNELLRLRRYVKSINRFRLYVQCRVFCDCWSRCS